MSRRWSIAARRHTLATLLALSLAGAPLTPAQAHRGPNASEASAVLSLLPVAASVAVPVGLVLSAGAFTVVAVEAVSDGTVWVLQRASDGAEFSVHLGAAAVAGSALVVGSAVSMLACSAGWVLSAGGRAVAIVPHERGRRLLHREALTP